jgi:hypothetical protein
MSHIKRLLLGVWVSALLACRGGAAPDDDALGQLNRRASGQSPPIASKLLMPASGLPRSATATSTITASAFLDWVERSYPDLLSAPTQTPVLSGFVLRYSPTTSLYLGVRTDGNIYALGPITANQVVSVGKLTDFTCLVSPANCPPPEPGGTPVTGHPRLWLTSADLPRLRSWATEANPLYRDGLKLLAARAKAEMDRGDVARDCGTREYEEFPTESYAELFAFMSLVEGDAAARSDYAQRARTLLMTALDQAAQGPANSRSHACGYPPFRDPEFFTTDSNRARWHGEAFPLVVDWIYPVLTTQDKQTIRTVFLRWSQEIVASGYHHPEPVGVVNDPSLLTQEQVRWSGNNYFTAHMRNLGLMALALDPGDDPGNQLRDYLGNATGAWLYVFDRLTRTDSLGGLLPEGFEYSPQTASYAAQFLLALRTAGADTCGSHCQLNANPFWDDFVTAYYHSLSPATVADPDSGGTAYLPASYGDAQNYRTPDFIDAFGAIGIHDTLRGNAARLNSLRWAQRHTAPGGAVAFAARVANSDNFRHSLLYFMLYDPTAASASDPHSSLALSHFAPGLNKILSRTSWEPQASWFTYTLGWNFIDHQTADGNNFEWYRQGEWLTKARSGYPDIAEGIGSSEFYNTLALQNNQPVRDPGEWQSDLWRRGSQWNYVASGTPSLLALSDQARFTYAMGDATRLYNSTSEGATDIVHASRSIVWLKQEAAVVVYDRAQSGTVNRFKRWWLQIAKPATVAGNRATSTTPGGQTLTVTSLLPAGATLSAVGSPGEPIESQVAQGEPMKVRLSIEAAGNPATTGFLTVLQATSSGLTPPVSAVASNSPNWAGALVGSTVVMFPMTADQAFDRLNYTVASAASAHLITGLLPNTGYSVIRTANGVAIELGGGQMTDAGGVIELR